MWKTRDSSEQNGLYKVNMTKEKSSLVQYKIRMGMPIDFQHRDVLPLVHRATAPSFRAVASNVRAMWDRGWIDCNYALLNHPELQKNPVSLEDKSADEDLTDSHNEINATGTNAGQCR